MTLKFQSSNQRKEFSLLIFVRRMSKLAYDLPVSKVAESSLEFFLPTILL